VTFLKAVLKGNILTQNSMMEMTHWVMDGQGRDTYGMGLYRYNLDGIEAVGHGGSGIGAGCALYYLPAQKLYLYLGVNLGTIVEEPSIDKVAKMKKKSPMY
jgi:D-alanyl-D-alanine carboxypeptidase